MRTTLRPDAAHTFPSAKASEVAYHVHDAANLARRACRARRGSSVGPIAQTVEPAATRYRSSAGGLPPGTALRQARSCRSACAAPGRSARRASRPPLPRRARRRPHSAFAVAARSLGTSDGPNGADVRSSEVSTSVIVPSPAFSAQRWCPATASRDGRLPTPICATISFEWASITATDPGATARRCPEPRVPRTTAAAIAAANRSVPPPTTSSRRRRTSARTAGGGAGVPSSGSWFRIARSRRCSSGPGSTPSSSASSSRVAR